MNNVVFTCGLISIMFFVLLSANAFFSKDFDVFDVKMMTVGCMVSVIGFGFVTYLNDDMRFVKLVPNYETRPATMEVIELDQENDVVIFADANGYRWTKEGIEDWHIGDLASCIMYTKETATIFDDEIKEVRYSGYNVNR